MILGLKGMEDPLWNSADGLTFLKRSLKFFFRGNFVRILRAVSEREGSLPVRVGCINNLLFSFYGFLLFDTPHGAGSV
jgi:hypothetical protein